MTTDRVLKHAFLADCRLPDKRSWNAALTQQLEGFLSPTPTADNPDLFADLQTFSLRSRQIAHEAKLNTEEGRTIVYGGIKEGYGCEPNILSAKNRHHGRIMAQFRTGSHWLNIETGRYTDTARNDRSALCALRKSPIQAFLLGVLMPSTQRKRPVRQLRMSTTCSLIALVMHPPEFSFTIFLAATSQQQASF